MQVQEVGADAASSAEESDLDTEGGEGSTDSMSTEELGKFSPEQAILEEEEVVKVQADDVDASLQVGF